MRYDLIDFRLFANIAEESNITRGAARSFLSVPAASHRIKNLEETLGVKLLQRNPQGVELTHGGRIYLAHARKVFAQLELLTSDLQALGSGIKGHLTIFANTTAISEFLPPLLGTYLPRHRNVQIDLRERLSDDAAKGVRDGAADLCIISGKVSTEGLESKVFLSSRLVVVSPPGHPAAARPVVAYADLLEEEFVSLLDGAVTQEFLKQQALALHRQLKVRVQVAGFDTVFRMVEAGVAIAIVPELVVKRLNKGGTVDTCGLSDPWAVREFQLCARSFAELPLFARDFVQALEEHTATYLQGDPG